MTAASNSLQTDPGFWNIFNCSPVEIYMRLRSLDGWVKSVHSQGSKPGHSTVLTESLMYAAWEESQRNLSFFAISFLCLAALSLPFCAFEPDLWLQFNSCNNTAYYGHDIIHSTISLHCSQNSCFWGTQYAVPPGQWFRQYIDFLPETQAAHLLDFHNCHYCTPQESDPTHADYKVWMGALYGTLEQLCGNQTCTILIFKRNIKACQTITNHELDPL